MHMKKKIIAGLLIILLINFSFINVFASSKSEIQNKIDDKKEIIKILKTYMEKYFNITDKEAWFNNIKDLTDELGYCSNMKEYKENPDKYKGSVADISTVIRVALTSRSMTPDLYEIMRLLGKDRIKERITKIEQL